MKLTYFPNTIAVASAIALNEAGLPHELVHVNFATGEQTKAGYLKINPKGRVPALFLEDGILTETGAILEYIAAQVPEMGLVPTDPRDAARMRSVMYYIASSMHVNHAHRMRGHRWADKPDSHADMTAKVPETMTASAAFIEAEGLAGPYVLGGTFSIADPYLFAVCCWLEGDKVDLAPFPKIRAFMAAMEARSAVQKARADGVLS